MDRREFRILTFASGFGGTDRRLSGPLAGVESKTGIKFFDAIPETLAPG